MIGLAVLVIGALLILWILLHAWKVLRTPREADADGSGAQGAIEQEAADTIWVEVEKMETNKNMTLSLKEAVLGEASQQKKLVVFQQKISDITKVESKGSLPFNLSAKYRYIKYSGTASYSVDLGALDDNHLMVDEEAKTITIYIPRPVEELNINEDETQADETEKIGLFSIGDLKQSEEERSEVIAKVKSNMKQKLEEDRIMDTAERMAKLSVWEIYQPVVSKVSPEYTVVTEFDV